MTTRVAIVGGGIAGLTLAGLLDPERFDVTIHEERPERRGAGSALGLWPSAWAALADLGLAREARSASTRVGAGALRDATGRALIGPTEADLDLILRPTLVDLLDSAVPRSFRRVDLRVDDPLSLRADIVVGADGVRSVVRRSAFGEHLAPRPTPWLALRGLLPEPPREAGEYWGRGDLAGVVPAPGGTTYWFTSHASTLGSPPPGHDPWGRSVDIDPADALREVRDIVAARPDRARAVLHALDAAEPETTLAQRIYETPRIGRLVHGRAVLVGDAAHAMTPNLGRGACEAMIDAHVLARELSRHETGRALRRYQLLRLAPAVLLPPTSRLLMQAALARGLQLPRDLALASVGRLVPSAT